MACVRVRIAKQAFKRIQTVAPEGAVVAHPVDQRLEAFRLGAVIDFPAFGALGDQAGLLQGLEVTPLPRVSSTTVISSELTTCSNTARRVGSASARMTALTGAASAMKKQ